MKSIKSSRYRLRDQVSVFNLIDISTKKFIIFTVVGIWKWNKRTDYKLLDSRTGKKFSCNKARLMKLVKRYEN